MQSRRLFFWCHTTSQQAFETGIQRVVRRLGRALGDSGFEVVPVGRDDGSGLVAIIGRGTKAFEEALDAAGPSPLLFIPELTADLVARGVDPASMARGYGMRTLTLVHDLIPLKLRDHYSAAAAATFSAYYESLAGSATLLVTTEGVARDLRQFLSGRALHVPPIVATPLPAQLGDQARVTAAAPVRRAGAPLKLVSVVTWERRKNLLRLIRATTAAQAHAAIDLTLVGRRGFDRIYDAEVDAMLAAATGITVAGRLPDEALVSLIAASDATVYPSWEEGFGLPVGESLWLGRPCLCHNASSLAEIAPGGGTLMIDMLDEDAMAAALVALATQPTLLTRLAGEAIRRPLTSWHDYAAAIAPLLS